MTASEWKAAGRRAAEEESVELALPSGMVLLARRPDPVQVAMWGQLPLSLASVVGRAAGAEAAPSPEDVMQSLALSRDLLVYCCVRPRISQAPQDEDEIHPRDLPMEDVLYILRWARREAETGKLVSFRGGRTTAGAGGDGEDVRAAAERAAGDHGADGGVGTGPGGGGEAGIEYLRSF